MFFLLVTELFGQSSLGLIASLLVSISPWHIPLSRGAFEANLTVFFTSFGFFFLLKAIREKGTKGQILASLFLGLNLFSYHSAKLITPLLVVIFLVFSRVKNKNSGEKAIK